MKRFTKIYLSVLATTFAGFILTLGFGAMAAKSDPNFIERAANFSLKTGDLRTIDERQELVGEISKVEIEWRNGDIKVTQSKDPALTAAVLHVKGETYYQTPPYEVHLNQGSLQINEVQLNRNWAFNFGEENPGGLTMELVVPASWNGELDIDNVNGTVLIDSIGADKISMETVNGTLTISGISHARELDIESVNGSVNVEGDFADIDANTVNGNIRLGLLNDGAWQFDLHSISGKIQNAFETSKGTQTRGMIKASAVSGNIEIQKLADKTVTQ